MENNAMASRQASSLAQLRTKLEASETLPDLPMDLRALIADFRVEVTRRQTVLVEEMTEHFRGTRA